jgi:hypothetical protein
MVLMLVMLVTNGPKAAATYLDRKNFTEPMFVFAIMVIAASRPILQLARSCITIMARMIPIPQATSCYFTTIASYRCSAR